MRWRDGNALDERQREKMLATISADSLAAERAECAFIWAAAERGEIIDFLADTTPMGRAWRAAFEPCRASTRLVNHRSRRRLRPRAAGWWASMNGDRAAGGLAACFLTGYARCAGRSG